MRARRALFGFIVLWVTFSVTLLAAQLHSSPSQHGSNADAECLDYLGGANSVALDPGDSQSQVQLDSAANALCTATFLDFLDRNTTPRVCTPSHRTRCRRPFACILSFVSDFDGLSTELAASGTPAVIASPSPPTSIGWSLGVLRSLAGNDSFDVEVAHDDTFYAGERHRMRLDSFLDTFLHRCATCPRYYLAEQDVAQSPTLAATVRPTPITSGLHIERTQLWVGAGRQRSRLHADGWDSVLWQFKGCRTVYLYHPLSGALAFAPSAQDRYFAGGSPLEAMNVSGLLKHLAPLRAVGVPRPRQQEGDVDVDVDVDAHAVVGEGGTHQVTLATAAPHRNASGRDAAAASVGTPDAVSSRERDGVPSSPSDDAMYTPPTASRVCHRSRWLSPVVNLATSLRDLISRGHPAAADAFERLQRHSRLLHAAPVPIVARICAGEALFVPSYWWHEVIHDDTVNIALNVWATPLRPMEMLMEPLLPGGGRGTVESAED